MATSCHGTWNLDRVIPRTMPTGKRNPQHAIWILHGVASLCQGQNVVPERKTRHTHAICHLMIESRGSSLVKLCSYGPTSSAS